MGHLIIKANQFNYKLCDRQLKGKFNNGISDEMITAEIITT